MSNIRAVMALACAHAVKVPDRVFQFTYSMSNLYAEFLRDLHMRERL